MLRWLHKFSEQLEVDFRRFYHLDYQYRDGTIPLRRVLVLTLGLDRDESLFWSALFDRDPFSVTDHLLMDIWAGLGDKEQDHPRRRRREEMEKQRRKQMLRARAKAAEKRRQQLFKARKTH